jgi:septum formation protein
MSRQIILASKSPARQMVLRNTGIPFDVVVSHVDETPIKKSFEERNKTIAETAMALADAKAEKVSAEHPDAYVIGADQILGLEGEGFDKPKSMEEAAERLQLFAGKTHHLHNAACIYQGGKCIWRYAETPALTMRQLQHGEINLYLQQAGEKVLGSVGAYMLEGHGARLFEKIEGDYFAILGLPLLPLTEFLRSEELIDY